jgi:hypothetical protein
MTVIVDIDEKVGINVGRVLLVLLSQHLGFAHMLPVRAEVLQVNIIS